MKKKICIITGGHWAAVMGGQQYQEKCILEELVKDNSLEIIFLARRINPEYMPKGYKIRKISDLNYIRRFSFMFDYRKLNKLLMSINPDFIYQRGLQPYTGFAAHYAKRNNCKLTFHVAHDFDVQPSKYLSRSKFRLKEQIEKKIGEYGLQNASKVITQTRQQRDLLKQNYEIDADVVVQNFHPKPIENIVKKEVPIKIVWVANFKPFKQPEIFVKLVEELQLYQDIEFIMIGRPGPSKKYNKLHQKIKSISNLKYLNELPLEEVNKILLSSHIFVNTSKAEGFANTFIQAWMRKVPVVSLNVNTDDNFDNQKIGIFGKSYEGLKAGVEKLIKDKVLRERMGCDAQKYAFEHHTVGNAKHIISTILDDSI